MQTPTSLRRPAVAVQLILSHGTGPARETDVALASRLVVALRFDAPASLDLAQP